MSSWAESAANKLLTALGCVGPKLEAVFGLPHFGLRGTRNCAKKGLCFRTLVSRVFEVPMLKLVVGFRFRAWVWDGVA